MLGDTLYAIQCLDDFLFSFEDERDSYDTYSQDIHLLGDTGYNRSSTGSCSPSHSCSDKYHFGTIIQ